MAAEVAAEAQAGEPLLDVRDVSLTYRRRQGWIERRLRPAVAPKPAVLEVSLRVLPGECLGIVGESGSGKTTLANCITGLATPSSGEILYRGEVVNRRGAGSRLPRARGVQIVFQDPYASLNPRLTVGSVLSEILSVHQLRPKAEIRARVEELLEEVGLRPEHAAVRPARLSGGQRQRVAIARALAFEPELVVADEIVSALDASVQAQILNLLARLRSELGLTVIVITHDVAVVRQLCERVAVMTAGRIVEVGATDDVLDNPSHPYTKELLGAVPRLTPTVAG
jgi:oligopeptide transport system ATP-binding protein